MLGTVAAGAGNLLLNVGPMQDGTIPEESIDILNEVGKWMESNGDAIYNSSLCPFTWLNIGRLTTKDNKVYLHIYYSAGDEICLAEIKNRVLNAKLLETGETVEFQQESERLFIKLNPKWIEEKLVPVIELEVDGKPEPITKQTNFWIMND